MGKSNQGYKNGALAKAIPSKSFGKNNTFDTALEPEDLMAIEGLLDNSTISERSIDDQYIVPNFFNLEANIQILKNPFHVKKDKIVVIMGDNKGELQDLQNLLKQKLKEIRPDNIGKRMSADAVVARDDLLLTGINRNKRYNSMVARGKVAKGWKQQPQNKEEVDSNQEISRSFEKVKGWNKVFNYNLRLKIETLTFNDIYNGNDDGVPSISPSIINVLNHDRKFEFSQNLQTDVIVVNNKQADKFIKILAVLYKDSAELDNKHDDIFKEFVYYHEIAHEDAVDSAGDVHQEGTLKQVIKGNNKHQAAFQNSEIYADLVSIIQLSTNPNYDEKDIMALITSIQTIRAAYAMAGDYLHYSTDALDVLGKSMVGNFDKYENIDRTKIYKVAGLINKISISNQEVNSRLIDNYGDIIQSPPVKFLKLPQELKDKFTKEPQVKSSINPQS